MGEVTAPCTVEIRCPECSAQMREFAHAIGEFTVLYCTVCVMTFRLDALSPSQTKHQEAKHLRGLNRGTLLRFPDTEGTRAS